MKQTLLRSAFVVALAGLCSCYTVRMNNMAGGPPTSFDPPKGAPIGHFDESRHAHFIIAGLINLGTPNISEVLTEQVHSMNGSGVANLQLTTTHTFIDCLVNGITFGIYNPVT